MVTSDEYWGKSSKLAFELGNSLESQAKSGNRRKKRKSTGVKPASDSRTFGDAIQGNDDENWFIKALETPVVKGALNILGTGSYAAANAAKYMTQSEKDKAEGLKKINPNDKNALALEMAAGTSPQAGMVAGLLKGLSAGIGQNENDVTTFSDVIKQGQNNAGLDTENDAAKWTQGIGGFVGDVAFDPTTYMGLGLAYHGAKGAIAGARDAGVAAKTAKLGGQVGEETNRLKGAVEQSKKEINLFRQEQYDRQEGKLAKKAAKKNPQSATPYKEDLHGQSFLPGKLQKGEAFKLNASDLRKAGEDEDLFRKSVIKDDAVAVESVDIIKKLVGEEIDPLAGEVALNSVAKAAESAPVGQIDTLAKPEPLTTGDKVMLSHAPKANVKSVPDSEVVVPAAKIIDDIPSELKVSDYQNYTPVDRFVLGTEYLTVNKTVGDVTKQTGQYSDIFKALRVGAVDPESSEKFLGFMRSFSEKPDMDMGEAIEKASEFVKTNSEAIQKSSRSFAPTAINGRLVNLNKGAGKDPSIYIMKTLPSENVNQYRIPLPPQQAEALLGEMLEKSKADIINGILPAETAQILDKVFTKHFSDYSTPSGPYTTNTGWGTSTRNLIDGDPKKEAWWTTNSAIGLFKDLNKEISIALKKTNLKGEKYAAAKDDMFMRVAQNVDVTLKGHGIFPYLTDVMPDGGTAIRASMFDVLDAMGPLMRQKYIHTQKDAITNLRVTQAMNTGEMLMRSILGHNSDGTLNFALIKPDTIRTLKGEYRSVADEQGIVRAINENLSIADRGFNDGIIKANIKNYNNATKARNSVYDAFFDDFVRVAEDGTSAVQKLGETVLRNTSLHSTKMSHQIVMAKQEALTRLQKAIEVGSVGQFHKQIGDLVSIKSAHNPEAAELLNKEIGNVKREFVTPVEEMLIDAQKEIERLSASKAKVSSGNVGKELLPNGKPKSTKWVAKGPIDPNQLAITKANVKAVARTTDYRLAPEDWVRLMNEGGSEAVTSLVAKDAAFSQITKLYPGQKLWNRTFGMTHSYKAVTGGAHIGTHLETAFHNQLNNLSRNFSSEEINQGFKTIQNYDGDILKYMADNPQHGLPPIVTEMGRLMDVMFGVGTNNFYSRNGVTARHMNDILGTQTHVPSEWRFDPNATPAEMADSWKAWTNIKNPLNAMAAVHTAVVKAAGDVTMGAKYSHFFGKTWKTIPVGERKNWAKVDAGRNAFAKLIDTDLYYPKEIIDELPALSMLITESRLFKDATLQKWVSQVFDPITSALKLTQTTMKPGHHVMSVQGDMLRNSLAGMNFSTKEYKHSWRILRARRKMVKELDGLDDYARLKTVAGNITAEDNGLKGVALTINGREVSLNDDTLYQMFEQRDIYLPVHSAGVTEDLLTSPTGDFLEDVTETGIFKGAAKVSKGVNEGLTNLTNNKVIKLNQFSADRDNFTRGALALHFMQSKNFKSVDEALEYASTMIRKWAPTAKDLTAAEAKSARRVIFYYTWLRGIIPRIIESSVKRPGWATMPSKAMYNLAVANGIDPQSLGDPFPEEEMFPDYYREGVLGPTWKTDDSGDYWGFNPTSPVMDVMNSLGSGVSVSNLTRPFAEDSGQKKLAETLMGMTHPAFRSPIELAQGRSLSTGAPIIDSGQYLTDMIGPVRFASKIAGHTISPNGIIPRRSEAKFRNGIEEEDWGNNAFLEALNYGLGAKVTNYTSDAATKSAEFDLKDEERITKATANRTEWWK